MRGFVKKMERLLFNVLRFDVDGYLYVRPRTNDKKKLHSELIDGYFHSQPGAMRTFFIRVYLFIKKTLLFVIRRIKRLRVDI